MSFAEGHLAMVAEDLGIPEGVYSVSEGGHALQCGGAAVNIIRRRLHLVFEATKRSSPLDSRGFQHEMEYEIPALLLQAMASSRSERHHKPPPRVRTLGLKKAIAFIESNAHEPTSVQEACRAAGVSWRTLDYAFRERLGVTPQQYMKAVRLSAVRRELHFASPTGKVVNVANRWGFWHMGKFAANYRRHFGELPSGTLGRFQNPRESSL